MLLPLLLNNLLTVDAEADELTGSARGRGRRRRAHKPLRKITLPDGTPVYATSDQIDTVRAEYEARVRQEGQAVLREERRVKEKGRKRAKLRAMEILQEIPIPGEAPIPIPKSYLPGPEAPVDASEIMRRKLAEIEREEEEAALLLIMLS
jgi:hypothetical protein